ncbi:MAG: Fe-S protein assembly co-chaperone HscB [Halioglobus sp.]|nr:Fe-S protein assembly co-chaperone HscB [Halioglobus sp.]
MTSSSYDFRGNFFELFGLPVAFAIRRDALGDRYRQLQGELHPDRFSNASQHEQRLAIQYSARVNEAYEVLRRSLSRALYLLELQGLSQEEISRQQIDGGFLITQMELREKLESLAELVDPDEVLEHLLAEIQDDLAQEEAAFGRAFEAADFDAAAAACVKMQYLDKLLKEAELAEADLLDE